MPAVFSLPVPGIHSLPDFSPALTQHTILACHVPLPAALLIRNMLALSTYLITIDSKGNFFGPRNNSSYSPSLRVLYARLTNGYIAPSPLPSQFFTSAHTEQSTHANLVQGDVRDRHLSDFQDLYYALLARIREMQKRMSDHLRSGFSTPDTELFPSGPTLASLHANLSLHWDLLNDAAAGKAMDEAIREARVQCIQDEIVAQVASNVMSAEEAEFQIMQLREKDVYEAQPGLEWTPEWDPALVNAKLREKYRSVLEECRKMDKKEGGRLKLLQRKKMEFGSGQAIEGRDDAAAAAAAAAEQAVLRTGGEVRGMEEGVEDGFVEEEMDIDRGEQEWLWQVEQMQHPAFRHGFSIDAQEEPDLELLRANASQMRYVPSIEPIQEAEPIEQIEVAQPVQQQSHQHTQPDGPAPAIQQEEVDYEQTVFSEERVAWRRELEAQRQRVSQYTAYLRSRASLQGLSMVGSARQSGFRRSA